MAGVRFVENHHLGFVIDVAAMGSDPGGGPPDFESEYAHERNLPEFSYGDDVPGLGLARVEAADHGFTFGSGNGDDI